MEIIAKEQALRMSAKRKSSPDQERKAPQRYQPPYPPTSAAGLACVLYWLERTASGKEVDPGLLLAGLEGSSIRVAELATDPKDNSTLVRLRLLSRGELRSRRNVDLATFCYMRLLIAFGGSFFIDTNKGAQQYYIEFQAPGVQTTLPRLVADAGFNEEVVQRYREAKEPGAPYSHYDYRPHVLEVRTVFPNVNTSEPKGYTWHGRAEAEKAALRNFDKNSGKVATVTTRDEYQAALRKAAGLIAPVSRGGEPEDSKEG